MEEREGQGMQQEQEEIEPCPSCGFWTHREPCGPVPFSGQERELLARVKERLEVGAGRYGPLKIADGRDLLEEATEELLDATIYLTGKLMELKAAQSG